MVASNPGTGVPNAPIASPQTLTPTPVWLQFFLQLWQRTGGAEGSPSIILDSITTTIGSILTRGAAAWQGLAPGPANSVLTSQGAAETPVWAAIGAPSFAPEAANKFLGGPLTGAAEVPTFRLLGSDDLPAVEYLSASVPVGSAVPLTTTHLEDVADLVLPAGEWDVWGNIAITGAVTAASAWINTVSATDPTAPNGGAYAQWGAGILTIAVGRIRITGPATVYLSINPTFTGSVSAYGFLGALQV